MKATKQVHVLGAVYTIYECKRGEDETVDANFDAGESDAYTDFTTRDIILEEIEPSPGNVADLEAYRSHRLRHELVHAFLHESGLSGCASGSECWPRNEEMVDWFAIQAPKIFKTFKEAGCL